MSATSGFFLFGRTVHYSHWIWLDPENLGIAIGILLQSCEQGETNRISSWKHAAILD